MYQNDVLCYVILTKLLVYFQVWNLLTRTDKQNFEFVNMKLTTIWILGFFVRYCILLPGRVCILFVGVSYELILYMLFHDDIYFHFSLTVIFFIAIIFLFVSFSLTEFVFKADLYDGNFRGYEFDPQYAVFYQTTHLQLGCIDLFSHFESKFFWSHTFSQ